MKTIVEHIGHVRKIFDWPGMRYHDDDATPENKFNRWCWHNLPLLVTFHHLPEFISKVSELVGEPVKPSYVFLSMYGPDGICPLHTDRPQCQYTVDLQVNSDGQWPIVIDEKMYLLQNNEAVIYSGTDRAHYRARMNSFPNRENLSPEGGLYQTPTFMDLVFFHFVPTSWMGPLS